MSLQLRNPVFQGEFLLEPNMETREIEKRGLRIPLHHICILNLLFTPRSDQ